MTEIDRNVPMPNPGGGRKKYPWATLEVGESFAHASKRSVARVHAYQTSKRLTPKRFEVRDWDGVSRVWRTA